MLSGCGRKSVPRRSKKTKRKSHSLKSSLITIRLDQLSWQLMHHPYGVGAVIPHNMPNGMEWPIAFASRTRHKSEKNYAQIKKEALAIVYGIKKVHQYLYRRKFMLLTDHQPLTSIFGPKKNIPYLAAAWLPRWAILQSAYNYDIRYKPAKQHCNADGLSRLPLPSEERLHSEAVTVFNMGHVVTFPPLDTRVGFGRSLVSDLFPFD